VAATASEAAFMSEGVIVGSNIGRLLFLAAWSLIGQQPGQYNSVGRSDRKRCFAAKSTLRLIGLLRGGCSGLTLSGFPNTVEVSSWPPAPCRRWVVA
jgi:hypothetical protein